MRFLYFLFVLISIFTGKTAFASEPTGNWCYRDAGRLLDLISITSQGEVYKVDLREGWNKPIYSEGVATLSLDRLTATLKNTASNEISAIAHATMTIHGDRLAYNSYHMDGTFRWKGSYIRCKR